MLKFKYFHLLKKSHMTIFSQLKHCLSGIQSKMNPWWSDEWKMNYKSPGKESKFCLNASYNETCLDWKNKWRKKESMETKERPKKREKINITARATERRRERDEETGTACTCGAHFRLKTSQIGTCAGGQLLIVDRDVVTLSTQDFVTFPTSYFVTFWTSI